MPPLDDAGAPACESREPAPRLQWIDLLAVFLLAIAGFSFIWNASHRLSIGLRNQNTSDVWFEADVSRVFYNMSSRQSDQYRSSVHPVFALFAYPVCSTLHKVAHLSLNDSADAFLALTAAAWVALMYLVILRLGFDRFLALFAALMGLVSASGMLFFSVPETYGLGSVSILLAIACMLYTDGTRWRQAGALLASACALSITVTNWSLGLLLTLRKRSLGQWIQLSANAFVLVTALWTVQHALMPTSVFFTAVTGERHFLHRVTPGVLLHTGMVFAMHSMVAPAVVQASSFGPGEDPIGPIWKTGLTFQKSWPGSASPLGIAAAVFWGAILLLGVIALARARRTGFSAALLLFLAFQFLLHALYGIETFMYALDWMPVLVIVAVYGFRELRRARWPAIVLFTAMLAVNNAQQFQHIAQLVQSYDAANPLAPPATVDGMK